MRIFIISALIVAMPAAVQAQEFVTQGWEFSAAAIILNREYQDAPIATNGGVQTVGSENFDDEFEAGFEVGGRTTNWDFRYFQVDSFSSTALSAGADTISGAVNALDTNLTLDTEIYSGEVNYFFNDASSPVRFLTGFRYIKLDEELVASPALGPAVGVIFANTDNDLYGLQSGLDALLFQSENGKFSISTGAKGGIYFAHTTSAYIRPFVGDMARDSEDEVAFAGEANLRMRYQFCDWLAIDAGYQVLWINGVALVGEQASTTAFGGPGGGATSLNHGGVIFHGGRIGLTAIW